MNVNDVMVDFQMTLRLRSEYDWLWLLVAADGVAEHNELDARYLRWLSYAKVIPQELTIGQSKVRSGFRWHECTMPTMYEKIEISSCLPSAIYENVKLNDGTTEWSAAFNRHLFKTWWAAYDALYQAYTALRFSSSCPVRSLKCPHCGLVQDQKPPASPVVIAELTECWACERYFEVNQT